MKHKVSELTGSLLDAAVAKAEGLPVHPGRGRFMVVDSIETVYADQIAPSRLWEHGGPIIEREAINIAPVFFDDLVEFAPFTVDYWEAVDTRRGRRHQGPTPLIAAMRAFVASRLGDEVDL